MSEDQGRRSTDIDPAVQLAIDHGDQTVRHWARNEFAVIGTSVGKLGQKIDAAALGSTREHAEVKATLDTLLTAAEAARGLEPRVAALEKKNDEESAAAEAVDKLRRQQRWMATFLVAAVPVAIIAAPHIH